MRSIFSSDALTRDHVGFDAPVILHLSIARLCPVGMSCVTRVLPAPSVAA